MSLVFQALAGLALLLPSAAGAQAMRAKVLKSAEAAKPKVASGAKATPAEREPSISRSVAATRVAEWVATSGDNRSLPYAIIDKTTASLSLFDGTGRALDAVPVLIGIAGGDDATPGVGSKTLAEIGPAEKTTPAGRFLAKFGIPFRGERILWVDYATSVAIHPIPTDAARKDRRRERMLSPTPDDNRITFGCINVPKAFYAKLLRTQFRKKGGYVYVLPDTRPIEEVFPRLRVHALMNGNAKPEHETSAGSAPTGI
jgi:hypothetical protein